MPERATVQGGQPERVPVDVDPPGGLKEMPGREASIALPPDRERGAPIRVLVEKDGVADLPGAEREEE